MPIDENIIKKLQEVADTLNKHTDYVMAHINNTESRLHELKVGVSAWIDEPLRDDFHTYRLGYQKCDLDYKKPDRKNKKWKIAIQKLDEDGEPTGPIIPLTSAKRFLRLAAYHRIDKLLIAITDETYKTVEKVQDAIDRIKPAVKQIETPRKKRRIIVK
jgi:hypothetical protein